MRHHPCRRGAAPHATAAAMTRGHTAAPLPSATPAEPFSFVAPSSGAPAGTAAAVPGNTFTVSHASAPAASAASASAAAAARMRRAAAERGALSTPDVVGTTSTATKHALRDIGTHAHAPSGHSNGGSGSLREWATLHGPVPDASAASGALPQRRSQTPPASFASFGGHTTTARSVSDSDAAAALFQQRSHQGGIANTLARMVGASTPPPTAGHGAPYGVGGASTASPSPAFAPDATPHQQQQQQQARGGLGVTAGGVPVPAYFANGATTAASASNTRGVPSSTATARSVAQSEARSVASRFVSFSPAAFTESTTDDGDDARSYTVAPSRFGGGASSVARSAWLSPAASSINPASSSGASGSDVAPMQAALRSFRGASAASRCVSVGTVFPQDADDGEMGGSDDDDAATHNREFVGTTADANNAFDTRGDAGAHARRHARAASTAGSVFFAMPGVTDDDDEDDADAFAGSPRQSFAQTPTPVRAIGHGRRPAASVGQQSEFVRLSDSDEEEEEGDAEEEGDDATEVLVASPDADPASAAPRRRQQRAEPEAVQEDGPALPRRWAQSPAALAEMTASEVAVSPRRAAVPHYRRVTAATAAKERGKPAPAAPHATAFAPSSRSTPPRCSWCPA